MDGTASGQHGLATIARGFRHCQRCATIAIFGADTAMLPPALGLGRLAILATGSQHKCGRRTGIVAPLRPKQVQVEEQMRRQTLTSAYQATAAGQCLASTTTNGREHGPESSRNDHRSVHRIRRSSRSRGRLFGRGHNPLPTLLGLRPLTSVLPVLLLQHLIACTTRTSTTSTTGATSTNAALAPPRPLPGQAGPGTVGLPLDQPELVFDQPHPVGRLALGPLRPMRGLGLHGREGHLEGEDFVVLGLQLGRELFNLLP
mmetsp:Transcript_30763/g.89834  ORF Transcript_30763/g.89834 Transcript_30763/m.89834 type:complete len:259 (-) Transcript_30763:306-1082(-)